MTDRALSFVTLFWPKKVKASKLEEIHAKMVMKEAAPRTAQVENGAAKKPRPMVPSGSAGRTNGSVPSSSSHSTVGRTNGKYR